MKKNIFLILVLISPILAVSQANKNQTFKGGEQLKYKVHYGFIDGGEASLVLNETEVNGKTIFHSKASAKSIGLCDKLFKVRDNYETFIDSETGLPLKAIRDINEDSYKYYDEILFNRSSNSVVSKRKGKVEVPENTMDILAALYFARNNSFNNLKKGDIISINTYFEDKLLVLQIRYKGNETIKTDFGKINCLKFSPVVEAGRIFESNDDLTIWISNDKNYLPIRAQMDLMIGSVKCDLVEYKNLKNSLAFLD